jgi:signal transduction histidine kinase/DNA-binding response OmpR family regulator
MKKEIFLYLALFGLIPLLYATGGVESPVRFLYYPLLVLFIPFAKANAHFQVALIFSILYSLIPLILVGAYPTYAVGINVLSFLLTWLATGRPSEYIHQERDSFRKSSDSYHGLTNALNLNIMNLQSKVDSLSGAYESLQNEERNKTRFISGVSHEIRSPLSSIRSFSEILMNYDDIEPETRLEFLEIINKESERLTLLANEILDVVRMESGKVEWHMDTVDMRDVINIAISTMQPSARDKGLSLEAHMPDEISQIKGDRNRLLQVLLNLLSNALKFTSHGRITVGIEETPETIKTYVADTGEGIYPEEKEKIFDEFYRIGDDLTGRPKGSGLGLNISKKIVEAHRGHIWVDSQLGKGSTFFFSIPKEAFMLEAEEKPEYAEITGELVLVFEGYQPIRHILRGTLESLGYKTLGAESTKTALNIIKIKKPNAIIMGYPKRDEYSEELMTFSRVQGIPLFIVSIVNDEKTGPQVAVNGYITKPFDINQISTVLEEILRGRTGRLMIISDNPEEARSLQVLLGARGHETIIVSDIDSIEDKRLPDVVVIGPFPPDEIYRIIDHLRSREKTRKVPILLTLDHSTRDIKCIGLGPSSYGNGLGKLVRNISERIKSV